LQSGLVQVAVSPVCSIIREVVLLDSSTQVHRKLLFRFFIVDIKQKLHELDVGPDKNYTSLMLDLIMDARYMGDCLLQRKLLVT
jgi:hypothetical protein